MVEVIVEYVEVSRSGVWICWRNKQRGELLLPLLCCLTAHHFLAPKRQAQARPAVDRRLRVRQTLVPDGEVVGKQIVVTNLNYNNMD